MKNTDNNRLEPLERGNIVIGSVDEVNGPGAQEIAEFVPTRHELIQILKYWTLIYIDHRYFYFLYRQYGSDWSRRQNFAERRMSRIQSILGEEATKVIDNVVAEFGKERNQRYWNIFINGSAEEWDTVEDEVHKDIEQRCGEDKLRK
jgi:hypothetical protein